MCSSFNSLSVSLHVSVSLPPCVCMCACVCVEVSTQARGGTRCLRAGITGGTRVQTQQAFITLRVLQETLVQRFRSVSFCLKVPLRAVRAVSYQVTAIRDYKYILAQAWAQTWSKKAVTNLILKVVPDRTLFLLDPTSALVGFLKSYTHHGHQMAVLFNLCQPYNPRPPPPSHVHAGAPTHTPAQPYPRE